MPCPRALVVCGPTATGKTALSVALARRFGGEIVNADSRQVYRFMDVGTAKPSPQQRAAVPHHLFDVVAPDEQFTLARYLELARAAIRAIASRGRLPIVVGGTGLYVRALTQRYAVPRVPPDPGLRDELETLLARGGPGALLTRLSALDPAAAARVDARNPRRLIRAIEVAAGKSALAASPNPISPAGQGEHAADALGALVVGLTADRSELYRRADCRVDAMMEAGFLREVEALLARGFAPELPALSGLGYRELIAALAGACSLDDAVTATKYHTHRFIRRQLTWFRREPGIRWYDVADADPFLQVEEAVAQWLAMRDVIHH